MAMETCSESATLPVCDDRSPRCWGSLVTGSLDMCAPDFVPGERASIMR